MIDMNETSFQEFLKKQLETKDFARKSASIAVAILQILELKNLTKVDLAALVGVDISEVDKWVKGGIDFNLSMITRIEEALETQLMQVADYGRENKIIYNTYTYTIV